jgi:Uma2 family endonuclease
METYALSADQALSGPPQGQWTTNDWEALPADHNRYEIIDGVLYMTTAPSNFHQWIVRRLDRFLGIPAEDQGLALCFTAPVGVILSSADAVQPDLLLVRSERKAIIRNRRIRGSPDLVAEVLSPGNTAYDLQQKQALYARAGVPEYVVINPRTRTLSLYQLAAPGSYGEPQQFTASDTVRFACVPTVALQVGDLFADAPDTEL